MAGRRMATSTRRSRRPFCRCRRTISKATTGRRADWKTTLFINEILWIGAYITRATLRLMNSNKAFVRSAGRSHDEESSDVRHFQTNHCRPDAGRAAWLGGGRPLLAEIPDRKHTRQKRSAQTL